MKKIDDYLKIQDAANLLGISTGTLRNWEKQGKLKAHRNPLNRYRLYSKQDLEALLKEINQSAGQVSTKKKRR